jgi:hypothetical protein
MLSRKADPELACGGDPSLSQSFLYQLAPVEALELGILVHRLHGCFAPEVAQQRIALLSSPRRWRWPLECSQGIIPM